MPHLQGLPQGLAAVLALLCVMLVVTPGPVGSAHPTPSEPVGGAAVKVAGPARMPSPLSRPEPDSASSCGTTPEGVAACAAAEASLHAPRAPLQPVVTWNLTCTPCTISARYESGMVYDATDGFVLLFGGLTATLGTQGDTWTYKAGVWTNITSTACPSGCPPPRFGMGMAYDAADGYVVMFGGAFYTSTDYDYYSDTWTFSGGVWTQVDAGCSPSITCPSARYYPAMTYDAFDGYVLLFGGAVLTVGPLDDTWYYLAGSWTNVDYTGGPSSREAAGMTYDAVDRYVLLFGGLGGTHLGSYFGDTWEYVGGSWTQLSPGTSPTDRAIFGPGLAYDSSIGAVVLYGGSGGPLSCDGDTWTYSGGSWTPQAPAGPTPGSRLGDVLSDDPADGTVVLFGGYDCSSLSTYGDTWTYYPGYPPLTASLAVSPNATDIGGAVTFTASAYGGGAAISLALRFGDGGSSTTSPATHTYLAPGTYTAWLWANNTLGASVVSTATVVINTLPVAHPSASPNPVDAGAGTTFSAGLKGGTAPFTYSWTFGDGGSSTLGSPSHVYAAKGTYTVHLWTNDTVGKPANGTFTVAVLAAPAVVATGTPTPVDMGVPVAFTAVTSGGLPPFTVLWRFGDGATASGTSASHAYATKGNYTARVWANDTAGGAVSQPVLVRVNPLLTLSAIAAAPSPTDARTLVNFSASFWGGTPTYATTWRFGDGGASSSVAPGHAYASPGNFTAWFWLNDSGGGSASSSTRVTVRPDVVISLFHGNFTASAPGTLDLGQALETHVLAYGGVSPLTYLYSQLPAGCTSVDAAWLSCTPTATGSFLIGVRVQDAAGRSAYANLSLVVDPALSLSGLSSDRSQVSLGAGVMFDATPTGGTAPFNTTYLGLPAGCASVDEPELACYPTQAGRTVVEVEVADATDASAFGNLSLVVNADPTLTFTATPTSASIGQTITFSLAEEGGTGPLQYTFADLPTGCVTPSPGLSACDPSGSGTFVVHVEATDADGRGANATATVYVAPAPNSFFTSVESFWWGWVLIGILLAVALAVLLDRRHKRRTGVAQGEEIDGFAPAPEGHPLADDAQPARTARPWDATAPEPGEPPVNYHDEPEVPPPPAATSVPPPPPTGPSPSAPSTAALPAAAPPTEGKWVAVPLSTPSASAPPTPPLPGTPPPTAPAARNCIVCNGPLDPRGFCAHCGVGWN